MIISLWGYMGSGKSTLGQALASRLAMDWFDLDGCIQRETGKSISTLFEQYGDYVFRKIERRMLLSLLQKKEAVISLGGGTPCFYNHVELINAQSQSVFLDIKTEELIVRLRDHRAERPILMEWGARWEQELDRHYSARKAYYRQAKHRIDAGTMDEQMNEILHLIGK